ncbi:hypothetical protein FRC11_003304, partial [Ceratobasidium sp. 423]
SYLIQNLSPVPDFSASPKSIAWIAEEAVIIWKANESKAKEEKKQKEEEKVRKAEEWEQKKQKRELHWAKQPVVGHLALGKCKQVLVDEPP